jgi:hypothetical protein
MDSISILHVSFSVKETNHLIAREVTPYQNNDPTGFLMLKIDLIEIMSHLILLLYILNKTPFY